MLRLAARYDGWFANSAGKDDMTMTPEDVAAGAAVVGDVDIVVHGYSRIAAPADYAAAGATWWLESLNDLQGAPEELHALVQAGPPRRRAWRNTDCAVRTTTSSIPPIPPRLPACPKKSARSSRKRRSATPRKRRSASLRSRRSASTATPCCGWRRVRWRSFDDDLHRLVDRMKRLMKDAYGVGLAG